MGRNKAESTAYKESIVALWHEGYNSCQAAKMVGCTREYIRLAWKEVGIVGGQPNRTAEDQLEYDKISAEVLVAYKELGSAKAVAERVKKCPKTIRKILMDNGISIAKNYYDKIKASYADRDKEIIKLYNQGLTQQQTADKIGKSFMSVRRCLIRNNIPFRNNKIAQEVVDQFAPLYAEGLSVTKISKKLGVSFATITKYLRAQGIEIRQGNGS